MTRTSKVLKRLGVASVAFATIGAGVPALSAVGASAVQTFPTGISISPTQESAQLGQCNPFTVTVTNPPTAAADTATVDVTISQTVAAQDANNNTTPGSNPNVTGGFFGNTNGNNANVQIGFCTPPSGTNPTAANPDQPVGTTTSAAPGGPGNNTLNSSGTPQPVQNGTPTVTCTGTQPGNTNPVAGSSASNTAGTATCNADFQINGSATAPNNGTFTFGIFSNYAGQLPVTAYIDLNDDDVPQSAAEPTANATKTFLSNANSSSNTVVCQPRTSNQPAGSVKQFVCTVKNSSGQVLGGVNVGATISSGPDRGLTVTCGQPTSTTPGAPVTSTAPTNSQGQATCEYTNNGGLGTDTINVFINGNATAADQITATFFGTARNINCLPKTSTLAPGNGQIINCTVTDLNGSRVANQDVQFTLTGVGRLNGASTTVNAKTDASGVATVTVSTFTNESGTATVTATLGTLNTGTGVFTPLATSGGTAECQQASGTTVAPGGANANATTAGNCSDTVTVSFTGSPSPSPTGTPGPRSALTLRTTTPLIPAGSTGTLIATGSANQQYQLQCYTRPSTTYFTARSGSFDAAANPVTFTLSLGRNTRCFIQYTVNPASGASLSVVINVRTVLSLSTVRTGVRTYIFQGRNLPRVAGQLITLYRVDSAGNEIRTSNLVTDASGIYRVTRTFTGSGTFQFRVRTSQTLNNAAGVSNTITVRVF